MEFTSLSLPCIVLKSSVALPDRDLHCNPRMPIVVDQHQITEDKRLLRLTGVTGRASNAWLYAPNDPDASPWPWSLPLAAWGTAAWTVCADASIGGLTKVKLCGCGQHLFSAHEVDSQSSKHRCRSSTQISWLRNVSNTGYKRTHACRVLLTSPTVYISSMQTIFLAQ